MDTEKKEQFGKVLKDALFRRIEKHADRRGLGKEAAGTNDYKEFLRLETEMIERYHRQGDSGLKVARARTVVIDVLLRRLLEQSMLRVAEDQRNLISLLALGGYGRAEMCPHSDVDIMFLLPQRISEAAQSELEKAVTEGVLYKLWDLGLKVGYSIRNQRDAIQVAQENVETKNALLEARYVDGSKELWLQFQNAYHSYILKSDAATYIQQRLKDQRERHEKHGGTVFLQSPDIKNGVGGLRDYQNILWMAGLKLDTLDLEELMQRDYLSKNEHKEFHAAYDFLLRTRNELHFQSQRATDVLDLELQPTIAWYLGYRQRDVFRRVEFFMRDYYQHALAIRRISLYIAHRLAIASNEEVTFKAVIKGRRNGRPKQVDGFEISGGILYAASEDVFQKDPERLIRVFRHAQQFNATIDLDLQRLIYVSRVLIDGAMIRSSTANRAFRAILQEPGNVFPALSLMNDTGVLRRFIPEWRGLYCLVQHEYYHRYTADMHTLHTIKELDAIFQGTEPEHEKYLRELRETEWPSLLYLALLLHDIGKGEGVKGHAERGAQMAESVISRMEVNPDLQRTVLFIIRHHLDMARFWQRYDVEDIQAVRVFSSLVGDEQTLRYLYVLTFCDARGTAKDLWNGYKDALHTQLFAATKEILEGNKATPIPESMIPKEVIREKLPTLSEEEIEAHYNLLPERYFIYHNADDVALHISMVNQLLQHIATAESLHSLEPIVHWHNDVNLSLSVVNVVTWDRAGLFYKLAGAFSVAGLSIVSSRAITRTDHITIDTFYVSEPSGGFVESAKKRDTVENYMQLALMHNEDLLPAIEAQARKLARPSWRSAGRLQADIPPSVDVYHELSLRRTIIEIQCSDRIGLLYRLAKTIFDHGFDINFARVSTENGVAVDTFYIERIDRYESEEAPALVDLRESLEQIVKGETEYEVNEPELRKRR